MRLSSKLNRTCGLARNLLPTLPLHLVHCLSCNPTYCPALSRIIQENCPIDQLSKPKKNCPQPWAGAPSRVQALRLQGPAPPPAAFPPGPGVWPGRPRPLPALPPPPPSAARLPPRPTFPLPPFAPHGLPRPLLHPPPASAPGASLRPPRCRVRADSKRSCLPAHRGCNTNAASRCQRASGRDASGCKSKGDQEARCAFPRCCSRLRKGSFQILQPGLKSCALLPGASADGSKAPPSPAKRGVVILPGLGNNSADYSAVAADLQGRGVPVEVAKVTRLTGMCFCTALQYLHCSLLTAVR